MGKRSWVWPIGLAAAGIGSAVAVLLRGCWHRKMSWPIQDEENPEFSYQVCMNCGAKRAFDTQAFRGYGAFSYDLRDLIARERLQRLHRIQRAAVTSTTRESRKTQPVPADDPGTKSA